MADRALPLRATMAPRDPDEPGRTATPLELLFDLVVVVAVASAAAQLHHGYSEGHLEAVLGYVLVFFAIWWSWMNFTWFASAYDPDDVLYRVLTFVIMSGALVFAAGVPDLFEHGNSVVAVLGYVIMRLGMVALWLRAADGHPGRRTTALTYAVGITLAQVYWVVRLVVQDDSWVVVTFLVGVVLELAVPAVAETRGGYTSFHPHHIAERYGLFTIIVLGEVILANVLAVQQAVTGGTTAAGSGEAAGHGDEGAVPTGELLLVVVGGLLIVYSLWWLYFKRDHAEMVAPDSISTWAFGYGHYVVFASVGAVGAALAAIVDLVVGASEAGQAVIALALGVPIALYLLALGGLHALHDRRPRSGVAALVLALLVIVVAVQPLPVEVVVPLIGLVLAGGVAQHVVASNRSARATSSPTSGSR
jgi:low temperature requirement protein LtrA